MVSRYRDASDRAAAFIIAQEDGFWSEVEQAALDDWLKESDGNRAAYWRLKHAWSEADRARALVSDIGNAREQYNHSFQVKWFLPTALAASIALVVGLILILLVNVRPEAQPASVAEFATSIGGHKRVELSEGSMIELNTASLVRVAVSKRQRDVWLDQGEAYFEVAHRNGQPFVVHAGSQKVTVLGTKFAVRRDGDRVRISVIEGRVRVEDAKEPRGLRSSEITAGDIALAEGSSTLVTTRSREGVEQALVWRDGMLSFDRKPLSEVVAEFNRYNTKPLLVVDHEIGDMRIGGLFPASQPKAFADLLREAYGLRVEETATEVKISN